MNDFSIFFRIAKKASNFSELTTPAEVEFFRSLHSVVRLSVDCSSLIVATLFHIHPTTNTLTWGYNFYNFCVGCLIVVTGLLWHFRVFTFAVKKKKTYKFVQFVSQVFVVFCFCIEVFGFMWILTRKVTF